jgi:hypothetical protein
MDALTTLAVRVQCNGCDDFPWWAEALLSLVGVAIAFAILYGLYRLVDRFLPAAPAHEGTAPPDETER